MTDCGCTFHKGELVLCHVHARFNLDNPARLPSLPRYTHGCEACVWLGAHDQFDLYWCEQPHLIRFPTLIARYGNAGAEYLTYNYRLIGRDPTHHVFVEALRLARVAGLEQ